MSLRIRTANAFGAPKRLCPKEGHAVKRPASRGSRKRRARVDRSTLAALIARRAYPEETFASCRHPLQGSEDSSDDPGRTETPKRRVLLKISGEALQGSHGCGIDPAVLRSVSEEIAASWREGYEVAVVVGGGNFFRGADAFDGIDRATADYVGMLATTMNAICLQSMLESFGVETRLQTAIEIREVAEPYIRRKAIRHLERGRIVIFGAGTGNPFFTTDMAAALRAAEINAHEILKATKVNGVYSSDPKTNPKAELLDDLSYDRALRDRLQVMDSTALSLCRDRSIPIRVFSLFVAGNISKAIRGEPIGTVIQHEEQIADISKAICDETVDTVTQREKQIAKDKTALEAQLNGWPEACPEHSCSAL